MKFILKYNKKYPDQNLLDYADLGLVKLNNLAEKALEENKCLKFEYGENPDEVEYTFIDPPTEIQKALKTLEL